MTYQIHVFKNKKELFRNVAENFVNNITNILHTEKQCRIVLGGGRTPVELNRFIVQSYRRSTPNWSGFHIYFSDERLVPTDHPDNTAAMIRNTLAAPLNMPYDHVHPIPTNVTVHAAADAYNSELTTIKNIIHAPLFHLALLGLGADGHIASLFPGSPALQERERLAVAVGKGPEGWERVTLTSSALEDAPLVWIVAAGRAKQPVIDRMINGPWDPKSSPLQGLQPKRGVIAIWVDKDAAPSGSD